MSSVHEVVHNSVRMGGRDTDAEKKTKFIDFDAIREPTPPPTEPEYVMWTEDHGVQSRIRREERANRQKPPPVAEVEDFDVERHLANPDAGAPKKKWKFCEIEGALEIDERRLRTRFSLRRQVNDAIPACLACGRSSGMEDTLARTLNLATRITLKICSASTMAGRTDRRRNLGPSDLKKFCVPGSNEPQKPQEPQDGLRPVFISQGIAAHASGSAYLEVGDVKLHATVHGPQQLRGGFNVKAQISVNVRTSSFSGLQDAENLERGVADFVRSSVTPIIILDEYPKSRIIINISVLSGSPGAPLIAAAVNAATMALVNAGIALHDMVTAVSVSQIADQFYTDAQIDSSIPELKQLVAAYAVSTHKLVSLLLTSTNAVSREDLRTLLDRAGGAAVQVRELFNAYLVEDYVKESGNLVTT